MERRESRRFRVANAAAWFDSQLSRSKSESSEKVGQCTLSCGKGGQLVTNSVGVNVTVTKLIKHGRTLEMRILKKMSACTKLGHKGVDAGFCSCHFLSRGVENTPLERK